jgi:3-oxoacyl-[acyl-carrier-protein] synthase-3
MGSRLLGIQAVVPAGVAGPDDVAARFGPEVAERVLQMTGVRQRHVAPPGQTTADLVHAAARSLLGKLGVRAGEVDGVILVTQTPDFVAPATACILQDRLGLPQSALAFDMNQGCSAYPYGLAVCHGLLAAGLARRVLLLVGDTASQGVDPADKGTAPLFGDGVAATLIEAVAGPGDLLAVDLGTDGSGWANLVTAVGASRYRRLEDFRARAPAELRERLPNPETIFMDGGEVFAFTLRVVPGLVRRLLDRAGLTADGVDYFFFHQANLFIVNHLVKRCGLPPEKCPVSIDRYGNTNGASPAITACDALPGTGRRGPITAAFLGFGVGYSWGGVMARLNAETAFPVEEL